MLNAFIQRLKVKNNQMGNQKKIDRNKKIKDVSPNQGVGINLLNSNDADEIIDQMIEEPLREACRIFKGKNIETVMSSANRENVLKPGEKPKEKEDVRIQTIDGPNFEDTGRGYAWIMLNYETLSSENKELLFSIEGTKNEAGEKIGEKLVWFIKPSNSLIMSQMKRELAKIEKDDSLKKFEEHAFVLEYSGMYPYRTVMLRMPLTEETTVGEVETYFSELASRFQEQEIEKQGENKEIEK